MSKRQKGNIEAQKERRKERAKGYPKVKPGATEILIDGNYSQYAVAFCNYHKGVAEGGMPPNLCMLSNQSNAAIVCC